MSGLLKFPRSLSIAQPHRGRTIRSVIRRLPAGRFLLDFYWKRRIGSIRRGGHRVLQLNKGREGRRFMAAIPHQFCGIGHSFCEWNTGFLWAHKLGLEFVDIPMKEEWHSFLGFGEGLPKYYDIIEQWNPVIVRLPYVPWSRGRDAFPVIRNIVESVRSNRDLLFILADGQNEYDHTQNADFLRSKFLNHGKSMDFPDHRIEGCINVAVHIRRGDVTQMATSRTSNWSERFVPEEWFISVIDMLRNRFFTENLIFNIYSQGSSSDLKKLYERNDCIFYLNNNERESLINMAYADVLLMSPSGFSYLAALLSQGIKIARSNWWHYLPNTKNWELLA